MAHPPIPPVTRLRHHRDGPIIEWSFDRIDESGEQSDRSVVYGFRAVPVFGRDQTEVNDAEKWAESSADDRKAEAFLDGLPLVAVARSWELTVESYNGKGARALGYYRHGQAIALGVQNVATWAHELIHAADDRRGKLAGSSKLSREVVAELGGAVLLACLGRESDADYGGCWQYVTAYAERNKQSTIAVCERLLRRTCEAVALILDTAEELATGSEAAA